MEKFRQIFQWVWYSSADPAKVSLTLKAGVSFLVLLGVSDISTLTTIATNFGQLVGVVYQASILFAQALSLGMTLYGLIRKVARSRE